MPQVIETTVYKFEELSEPAKDRAREWYREGAFDFEWWDSVYEDFAQIAEVLGLRLQTHSVKLMNGSTRQDPDIWFTLNYSQGDGASFDGSYSYAALAHRKIRAYAPKDSTLHMIADRLFEAQRANGYKLHANIKSDRDSCISIEVEKEDYSVIEGDTGRSVSDAFRSLAQWLYEALRAEYEFQSGEEQVDETIQANEYTFTIEGRRFG